MMNGMSVPRMARPAEDLRLRAVMCVEDGEMPQDVARLLAVSERSVWRWLAGWREDGLGGLCDKPRCGRPEKLTAAQADQVLGWLEKSPCDFGFATERWTAMRVARVIEGRLGVRMNGRYLCAWLRRRGITPQMPRRVPRERDQSLIDTWIAQQWPRIKKRRAICMPA
jgi:transposase